jgi:RNA polymerase sigma-70 factor (ECF subfamily)
VVVHLPGIERAWETWEVKSALEQLPDEERHVVWLAHFHGMTHPQIAEQLGVPVGTVKSRSFRAHKRLAALLEHVVSAEGAVS